MTKTRNEFVPVHGTEERQAVRDGRIEGDVYSDGEIWADPESILKWRKLHNTEHYPDGN